MTTKEQARKAGMTHSTKWNHSERHETDTAKFVKNITQSSYYPSVSVKRINYVQKRIKSGLPVEEHGKFHNPPKLNLSQNTLERIRKG